MRLSAFLSSSLLITIFRRRSKVRQKFRQTYHRRGFGAMRSFARTKTKRKFRSRRTNLKNAFCLYRQTSSRRDSPSLRAVSRRSYGTTRFRTNSASHGIANENDTYIRRRIATSLTVKASRLSRFWKRLRRSESRTPRSNAKFGCAD